MVGEDEEAPINCVRIVRAHTTQTILTANLSLFSSGTGVTVNAVNPGPVHTNLFRYFSYSYPALDFIIKYFGIFGLYFVKNAYQGAQTSIYCAVEEKLTETSGVYFRYV